MATGRDAGSLSRAPLRSGGWARAGCGRPSPERGQLKAFRRSGSTSTGSATAMGPRPAAPISEPSTPPKSSPPRAPRSSMARTRHGAETFAIVGLCSGATNGAPSRPVGAGRPGRLAHQHPGYSITDERLRAIQRACRAGVNPQSAKLVARSCAARSGPGEDREGGRARCGRPAAGVRPGRRAALVPREPRRHARRPRAARDVRAVRLLGPDEGLEIANALPGGLDGLRRRPNVAVALVPGAGHTFTVRPRAQLPPHDPRVQAGARGAACVHARRLTRR